MTLPEPLLQLGRLLSAGATDVSVAPVIVRTVGSLLPLGAAGLLWLRASSRQRAAALLATLWNLPVLLAIHLLALRAGWWSFEARGGLLGGIPFDLLLGWMVLWGALPVLALRRVPLAVIVLGAAWIDLLLMPRCAPLLRLGPGWLQGELLALGCALLPAQLLGRWTASGTRLPARVIGQVLCFGALTLFVLPQLALDQTGGSWRPLLVRPEWITSLILQVMAIPAVLGLSAVQELAERGGGTPLPMDPPVRLVTSGPYRYVANPMQLGFSLVLLGWGLCVGSAWVAAGTLVFVAFAEGLARWDEEEDLGGRFGDRWAAYRRWVPRWRPRWRPAAPKAGDAGEACEAGEALPVARLYLARGCGLCQELRDWLEARQPVSLELRAAQEHPGRDLDRLTYEVGDPADGDERVETGVAALGRALEHLQLGWALVGMTLRLPLIRPLAQLLADASGAGPRRVPRDPAGGADPLTCRGAGPSPAAERDPGSADPPSPR